jgi:hypothetical protein
MLIVSIGNYSNKSESSFLELWYNFGMDNIDMDQELRQLYAREAKVEQEILTVLGHRFDSSKLALRNLLEQIRVQIQLVKMRKSITDLIGVPDAPE